MFYKLNKTSKRACLCGKSVAAPVELSVYFFAKRPTVSSSSILVSSFIDFTLFK